MSCRSSCPRMLTPCGHPCPLQCHPDACPASTECSKRVTLRCPCKRRKKVSDVVKPDRGVSERSFAIRICEAGFFAHVFLDLVFVFISFFLSNVKCTFVFIFHSSRTKKDALRAFWVSRNIVLCAVFLSQETLYILLLGNAMATLGNCGIRMNLFCILKDFTCSKIRSDGCQVDCDDECKRIKAAKQAVPDYLRLRRLNRIFPNFSFSHLVFCDVINPLVLTSLRARRTVYFATWSDLCRHVTICESGRWRLWRSTFFAPSRDENCGCFSAANRRCAFGHRWAD